MKKKLGHSGGAPLGAPLDPPLQMYMYNLVTLKLNIKMTEIFEQTPCIV